MSPAMASRPSEEEALTEFLDSASTAPSALLVDGEAGIGKTTVWLAGLRRARDRGFRVLSARGAHAESGLADALTDRRAVAAAFLSVVDRLTDHGPVLLAIDDLQWLDPSTVHVIGFVARRLHGPV